MEQPYKARRDAGMNPGEDAGSASYPGFKSGSGSAPKDQHGTVVLMSLYLILVAFFVMLNSMAQLEESRMEDAMGSVKAEFRNELLIVDAGPTIPLDSGLSVAVATYHDEVRRVFEDNLPIDHVDPERRGDILSFAVPADDLFRPGEVAARPRGRTFLAAMADSLMRARPGLRAEVEMVLGTGVALPDNNTGGGDEGAAFELHRATSLAHALRRRGVGAAAISTGLVPGDPGQVLFIFQVREEKHAARTFSELVVPQ
jgi:hypothetical protein